MRTITIYHAVAKTIGWASTDKEFTTWKVQFAVDESKFAAMLWRLYSGGYMNATSVGFIPILVVSDDEKDKLEGQEGLTYPRNELIELSLCKCSLANRHALSQICQCL